MWKKVLGWILFTTGTFVAVIIFNRYWQGVLMVLPMLIITVIPILSIWGGWKLAHGKKVK